MPAAVVRVAASTPHSLAAAFRIIARAAAPTCLIGSQLVGVAVDPPAVCTP